ncbi:TPA: glycosyltransferase [Proteus mirabilis]|nr:glycosyltransferase [Proteus mirabilis]
MLSKGTNFLISIIMPSYNSGEYIRKSIDSVLNQSYKNF